MEKDKLSRSLQDSATIGICGAWGVPVTGLCQGEQFILEERDAAFPDHRNIKNLLRNGEFGFLGEAPLFCSKFIEVTKKNKVFYTNQQSKMISIALLCTHKHDLYPDTLVLANHGGNGEGIQLRSMYPLTSVKMSVTNVKWRVLKIHLWSGRHLYLQQHAPSDKQEMLFRAWISMIELLEKKHHVVPDRSPDIQKPCDKSPTEQPITVVDMKKPRELNWGLCKFRIRRKAKDTKKSEEDKKGKFKFLWRKKDKEITDLK